MRESINDGRDNTGVVLRQKAEDEGYQRYKHLCYRNLAIEAALAFVLSLLLSFLFKAAEIGGAR